MKKVFFESLKGLCLKLRSKDGHPYVFWITGSLAGKRQLIDKTKFRQGFKRFYPTREPERYREMLRAQEQRNRVKIEFIGSFGKV